MHIFKKCIIEFPLCIRARFLQFTALDFFPFNLARRSVKPPSLLRHREDRERDAEKMRAFAGPFNSGLRASTWAFSCVLQESRVLFAVAP